VVITYELASVLNRLISNGIDLIGVYLINYIRHLADGSIIDPRSFVVEGIFLIWFYHLLVAIFFRGKTIGMRAMGLQPIKPAGGNVEFSDLFLRWITRPLDITLTCCALAVFLMLGSEKRQRLGDMLAGTVIVRKKHSIHFGLNDILAFHEKATTENIRYPEVRHMAESDMLLIKNLLHNQGSYSNSVHESAMAQCSARMADLLGLDYPPSDHKGFLQTLVNDYIILTR
jgi:uncharacterized RDD family membrane protein YckC